MLKNSIDKSLGFISIKMLYFIYNKRRLAPPFSLFLMQSDLEFWFGWRDCRYSNVIKAWSSCFKDSCVSIICEVLVTVLNEIGRVESTSVIKIT